MMYWVAIIGGACLAQFGLALFLADRLLKLRQNVEDLRESLQSLESRIPKETESFGIFGEMEMGKWDPNKDKDPS